MRYKHFNSQNLYSLYKRANECQCGVILKKSESYEMVFNTETVWPNCVFNISSDPFDNKFIADLSLDIKLFTRNPIIITVDNTNLDILLRKNGYMPVDFWNGMHIVPVETRKLEIQQPQELGYVDSQEDLIAWLKLVSDELFSGNSLSVEVFKYFLSKGSKLFFIKLKERIIATTMIYRDENNIDGIYMVCVGKSYRGQGYGKLIVNHSLQFLHKLKSELCVLQSTRMGSNLYKSIGFINSSRYNLFMKIK